MEPQEGHLEHNESVVGKEISSKGLLPATPELHYNEIVDQHLLLEKPQLTELNVRLTVRRSKTI